eukprot:scaffold5365_cov115-Isochrysis_galbana.AAC.1
MGKGSESRRVVRHGVSRRVAATAAQRARLCRSIAGHVLTRRACARLSSKYDTAETSSLRVAYLAQRNRRRLQSSHGKRAAATRRDKAQTAMGHPVACGPAATADHHRASAKPPPPPRPSPC